MKAVPAENIARFEALVSDASKIVAVTHTHPDGDALGSTSALYVYLTEKCGKEAAVIVPDEVPANLDFIVRGVKMTDAKASPDQAAALLSAADLVICLDFNTLSRTAGAEPLVRASDAPRILIDHHLNPETDSFDLVFSETEISSASELLYHLLIAIPSVGNASNLPPGSLRALMAGMTTDTNNFANSVFPSTLSMASDLLDAGVDRDEILSNLYNRYGENRFRAMGAFLSELMHITPDGVAYSVMDRKFLEKYGIREGDTEGFVNLPLGIERVKISVFLKEETDFFRVSIRSKKGWSANGMAKTYFNGGGHECASGGRLFIPGDIPEPGKAAEYVEAVSARFMRDTTQNK